MIGRGVRIGHFCTMVREHTCPSVWRICTSSSSIVYAPSGFTEIISPSTPGGIITLCTMDLVSGTSARIVPDETCCPVITVRCVSHFFSRSSRLTAAPFGIKTPYDSAIASSGLSIPSKILFKMPGASVTVIGPPVPSTNSPGIRPEVSSYTCTVVFSLARAMTSPTSFFSPT